VAGFKVVPSTSRELDAPLVADLTHWLRGKDGFDDRVVRRCRKGPRVGFSLLSELPDGSEDTSEIVIDFACNSFLLVRERDLPQALTASFFDASRSLILSLTRRALPADGDFTSLR
jgi:hypothetical protein